MKYNLVAIRKLIAEAFDDEELTAFCHDYFGEVIERFGSGMSKSMKVLQLITYCDRREELDKLLEKVKAERPKKYEKYQAQLGSSEVAPSVLEELRDDQATKAAISDRLDSLARRAGPDDTVVLFFSGHGAQRIGGFEPGEYLCPVEADWYNLRATAISDEELTTAFAPFVRNGSLPSSTPAIPGGGEPKDASLAVKPRLSEATYERLASGKGREVIASCKPDEVSWELAGMRNGLFTHYLLEGWRGAAAGKDGAVRIFNLFDHVSQRVPQHKPQHPLFKGEIELNFAIAPGGGLLAEPVPSAPVPGEPAIPPTTGIDPDRVDPAKLRRAMHSAYDRPVFEILCQELGLDYHDLRGETLETKMLYLIDRHQRHHKYADLVRKVLADHPYLADALH